MGQFYFDIMANYAGAATTATTIIDAGIGSSATPYAAKKNGFLQKVTLLIMPQAATSLCQSGYVTLNCPDWTLNTQLFAHGGFGIQTALAPENVVRYDYPAVGDGFLNLPVSTTVPITISWTVYTTSVTPQIYVQGMFSAS